MINLLPPEIKENQQQLSKVYSISVLYIIIFCILGAGAAGLYFYKLEQKGQIDQKSQQLSDINNQKKQNDAIVSKAAFIEDRTNSNKTYADTTNWDEILNQVASSTPTDIQLTEVKFATDATSKLTTLGISGKVNDRRSIVLFKEKLDTVKTFTGTRISDITDADNNFTFTIQANINLTTTTTQK